MAFPSFWEDLRRAFTSEVAIAAAQTELISEGSLISKHFRLKEISVVHKVDWRNFSSLAEASLFDEDKQEISFSLSSMQKAMHKAAHETTTYVQTLIETNSLKHGEINVVLQFVNATVSLSLKEKEIKNAKGEVTLDTEGIQKLESEWQSLKREVDNRKSSVEHAIRAKRKSSCKRAFPF